MNRLSIAYKDADGRKRTKTVKTPGDAISMKSCSEKLMKDAQRAAGSDDEQESSHDEAELQGAIEGGEHVADDDEEHVADNGANLAPEAGGRDAHTVSHALHGASTAGLAPAWGHIFKHAV